MQGGLRKGNAREKFALGKINDGLENRRREQMMNSSDSSRYIVFNMWLILLLLKTKRVLLSKFLKDDPCTSEVLMNTLMHKKYFQNHAKQAMMKNVQE